MKEDNPAKVLSKMVNLIYNIDKHHEYCYVTLTNTPSLPGQVLDEIETISFIERSGLYSNLSTPKGLNTFYANQLIPHLYHRIGTVWELEFGIPTIHFTGHTKALPKFFKEKDVMLFPTHMRAPANEITNAYYQAITLSPSIAFYTETFDDKKAIKTSDKDTALAVVKKFSNRVEQKRLPKQIETPHSLMNRWFGNELTSELFTAAKVALNIFLHDTKLEIYIPEFVVVYADRVKHHQRGHEYLQKKYGPQFVMTRHLVHNNENYSILFPVHCNKNIKG